MIALSDFGIILLTAVAAAAVVAVIAGIVLRIARHKSMLVRMLIVVGATVVSIAAPP